jgi:mRNA interferase HigB
MKRGLGMTLRGQSILVKFMSDYPDSKKSVEALKQEIKKAKWSTSNELKAQYGTASILGEGCVVFNICGNKYRLVAKINYQSQILRVRWAGTHKEYDKLDIRGTKCLSSK